jgi:hypothetical protein
MDHEPVLIATIAIGLVAAFVGGLIAHRLRLPTIVGYIVAGVVIGPFTPGLIADRTVAAELAEVGIILLLFGVGSTSLRTSRGPGIAIPGALIRSSSRRSSAGLGVALGWGSVGTGARVGRRREHRRLLRRSPIAAGSIRRRAASRWLADRRGPVTIVILVLLQTIGRFGTRGRETDAGRLRKRPLCARPGAIFPRSSTAYGVTA